MISEDGAPFDLIGERYDESFVDRAAQLEAGEWLIEQLPAGARVLDHGCGSGSPTAVQLAKAGLTVTGVDESSRMLELAGQRAPTGEFLRRDLRELGPDLGQFDAVVSFFALLMLPRQDVVLVLRGLRERLRGPGLLVLAMVEGSGIWRYSRGAWHRQLSMGHSRSQVFSLAWPAAARSATRLLPAELPCPRTTRHSALR